MLLRSCSIQLFVGLISLSIIMTGQAEPLVAEKVKNFKEVVFQVSYNHLPLAVSMPKLENIGNSDAAMKVGLGTFSYCHDFTALDNPLNETLGISKDNLNFLVPETVAKITIGVGSHVFRSNLQAIKEVCDYEGEEYVLYALVAESDDRLELPLTRELLAELQSASPGTLEVEYSVTKDFNTDGVLDWSTLEISKYAGAALNELSVHGAQKE